MDSKLLFAVLPRLFCQLLALSLAFVSAEADDRVSKSSSDIVAYEDFGAVGDGVTDDLPAIVRAHEHANEQGLPVKARSGATYHLGRRALTATIATDTDWGNAKFIIDDTDVEDHQRSLFEVKSLLAPIKLKIASLHRDQRKVEVYPEMDCWVRVESTAKRRYIRRGLNQNKGQFQNDCFILSKDGTIEGDIDWDYETISRIEARPIDEKPLVVSGGEFTTIANQMKQEKGYNYWHRNIHIARSNTSVVGLKHYVTGEKEFGHPYSGFLSAGSCANVTLRDCFLTAHKTYKTLGVVGKPVSMGSYDLSAGSVVNYSLIGCRMDNICDTTRWGVIGTNYCKNILLENCVLSRMDTHQGMSGDYIIRGTTLGYIGLNAIGRGRLIIEDSTIQGRSFFSLRSDYGSTWDGTVEIRNSRWIPSCGKPVQPILMQASNDGEHDFGYPCSMPREIVIDGLEIDDRNHPEKNYKGPWLFSDPGGSGDLNAEAAPFPYVLTEKVSIKNLKIASKKKLRISPNQRVEKHVKVIWEK